MAIPGKADRAATAAAAEARRQKMQNEKRFQEIEQALVDLLAAVEALPADAAVKRRLKKTREYLENRVHQPRAMK